MAHIGFEASPNCVGCGRHLQIRGRSPHPSERFCGWCVQRLRAQPPEAGCDVAGSGRGDPGRETGRGESGRGTVRGCEPETQGRSPSQHLALVRGPTR